ncbi:MAG TPA: hypothetical protein VFD02_01375 [Syntrophomonadaceae bacterium]|nr:hypothetical protein [Syntrophomonadaceae bacterium]
MKIRPIKLIIIIFLVILLILFLSSYIQFRISKIDNIFYDEFKENTETLTAEDSFYMHELTPFTWDRLYIIRPYTTKKEMQEIVGIKWTTAHTYIGYLWDKTYFGNNPLDDDIFHKLVFVNKGQVILDITIMRDLADFTYIDNMLITNEDVLQVDKTDKRNPKIKRIDK